MSFADKAGTNCLGVVKTIDVTAVETFDLHTIPLAGRQLTFEVRKVLNVTPITTH